MAPIIYNYKVLHFLRVIAVVLAILSLVTSPASSLPVDEKPVSSNKVNLQSAIGGGGYYPYPPYPYPYPPYNRIWYPPPPWGWYGQPPYIPYSANN